MAQARRFEVTVEGQYYAGTKNNKIPVSYEPEKFIVPDLTNALHTVQRKLLDERLKKKYKDYTGWRTCKIVSTRPVDDKDAANVPLVDKAIADMTLTELEQFVVMQELDVNVHSFGSVVEARKAVSDAFDDKKLREKQAAEDKARQDREEKEKENLRNAQQTGAGDGNPAGGNLEGAEALDELTTTTEKNDDPLGDL